MKFISVPVFIISLAIGLFLAYITTPDPGVIYVYPNPDTEESILFKDKSDTCFKYISKNIKCPNDITKIRSYNIQ